MTPESRVLIVEDDPEVRHGIAQALDLAGLGAVLPLPDAEQALRAVEPGMRAVVVTDVRLPGIDGLQLLVRLKALDPALPVIVITGHGDVQTAVEAMRAGAADFLEKPFSSERLAQIARQALLTRCAYLDALQLDDAPQRIESQIVGRTRVMCDLRHKLLALADVDASVLIFGETGTGKESAARSLHAFGSRGRHPFVALNCAGLPESLFDSEIFGHEPGAFTGATARRIGRIEFAGADTLFLDEIETMPMLLQAKLLRVLQERSFERLGSNESRPMQCRIVAGTKVDLRKLATQGGFREDLYYRLAVVELRLPPLRERLQDVPLLFQKFVFDAAKAAGVPLRPIPGAYLSDLMTRDWPGNVRELRNAAERFVLGMLSGDELGEPADASAETFEQRVSAFERHLIVQALQRAGGRVSAAAADMGLARKTLYDKMRKLGVARSDAAADDADVAS
ncbi:MAG: sigma-54-dependent Fis family transcriptional regulator [Betaproteobacteria bacterium]|nr:sigma-54-dependent Fis family transcriptional regulator [Betaproteobacteria bacterium]